MTIHVYKSTDLLAPTFSAAAGGLLTVLDACLVNGYATVAWAGAGNLTQTGNVATFTATSAHGLVTGDYVTVAGATQSDYNITAIVTVSSSVIFTYPVSNNPASPATGSPTCKKAGAQYTINQTGTNIRTYRAGTGNQFVLGVDDTSATQVRIRGYDSASAAGVAAGSGTNPAPTDVQFSGGLYGNKAAMTTGYWVLVSNRKMFYFFQTNATNNCSFGHGDFTSYVAADAYNSIVFGQTNTGTSAAIYPIGRISMTLTSVAAAVGSYATRSYNQSSTSAPCGFGQDSFKSNQSISGLNSMTVTYPSPVEGGVNLSPIWVYEGVSGVRGHLPGLWAICAPLPFTDFSTVYGAGTFAGKTFLAISNPTLYQCLLEVSDTWA